MLGTYCLCKCESTFVPVYVDIWSWPPVSLSFSTLWRQGPLLNADLADSGGLACQLARASLVPDFWVLEWQAAAPTAQVFMWILEIQPLSLYCYSKHLINWAISQAQTGFFPFLKFSVKPKIAWNIKSSKSYKWKENRFVLKSVGLSPENVKCFT